MLAFSTLKRPTDGPLVTALIILTLITQWDSFVSVLALWTGEGNTRYTHGIPLTMISVWLCYKRWKTRETPIAPTANRPSLIALSICIFAMALATIGNVLIAQQLLLPVTVFFVLSSAVGFEAAKKFAAPIGLILFAIPIWEYFNTPLRQLTTPFVTFLLNVSSIPAVADGYYILVPAGTFLVDVSCSGLNQFIIALVIGSLYAYLASGKPIVSGVIILSAGIVAFLVNTFRIYLVIVSGQLTAMQHYFITVEHISLGWVLFGISMFLYLYLLNKKLPIGDSRPAVNDEKTGEKIKRFPLSINIIMIAAIVLIGSLLINTSRQENPDINLTGFAPPAHINGWKLSPSADKTTPTDYGFIADLEYLLTREEKIAVNIDFYIQQRQGQEAVNELNQPYNPEDWKLERQRHIKIAGSNHALEEMLLTSRSGEKRLILRGYFTNGKITGYPAVAKLHYIAGTLQGSPETGIFTFSTSAKGSLDATQNLLGDFAATAIPEFIKTLNHLQGQRQ